MFGVVDLYTILAGGAWLTGHSISESNKKAKQERSRPAVRAYYEKFTDKKLEESLRQYVNDKANTEEIWRTLETYKRDNPALCSIMNQDSDPFFGWRHVGKERIPLFSRYGYLNGRTREESYRLQKGREAVLQLLMQTHGKLRAVLANSIIFKRIR